MPIKTNRIGVSRSVSANNAAIPGLAEATPKSVDQRAAQRNNRPQTAHDHCADAQVANLLAPDCESRVRRGHFRDAGGQFRVILEVEGAKDRQGDVPRKDSAHQHQDSDIYAHDVADANQCGRKVRAYIRNAVARNARGCLRSPFPDLETRLAQLQERAHAGAQGQEANLATALLTGLEHLGGSLTFRKSKVLGNDQGMPERDRIQHTEEPAHAGDHAYPPVIEHVPVVEHQQRRQGEDHAGSQRFTRRSRGLHDVVLQDVATLEHAQHRHRHHRGGNGGRNRKSGEQSDIGVGPGKNDGQQDTGYYRLDRQLRHEISPYELGEYYTGGGMMGSPCGYSPQRPATWKTGRPGLFRGQDALDPRVETEP